MLMELERLGSVRAAAESLHLSQPAVSKTLGEVERALGIELFIRGARGMKPSPRGQVVLRGAAVLLSELGHLLADARQVAPKPRTTIRLGMLPFAAQTLAPALLSRLLKGSDAWQVEISEGGVMQLFDAVLRGELDAALSSYSAAALSVSGSDRLRYDKLAEERFVVVSSIRHPLATRRKLGWQELAGEPWILPSPGSFLRQALEARFIGEGIAAPTPLVVSNNPVTNLGLVAQGVGIASVPASTIGEAERGGKLCQLRIQPEIEPAAVALVYREGAQDHERVATLRQAAGIPGRLLRRTT
ncbi:LysR family transcriptional regulator [Variovorax rhizosphaerae]|uniref:LysR family transcriptional regulator n=1 Tax=Variovorax rhizosphaerae TaxID=1836200 RepID=A0ABU8WW90_9BURK